MANVERAVRVCIVAGLSNSVDALAFAVETPVGNTVPVHGAFFFREAEADASLVPFVAVGVGATLLVRSAGQVGGR
jgi:hypothetical protein